MYRGESQLVMESRQKQDQFLKTLDVKGIKAIATSLYDDCEIMHQAVIQAVFCFKNGKYSQNKAFRQDYEENNH